jgi:hypothetical protein
MTRMLMMTGDCGMNLVYRGGVRIGDMFRSLLVLIAAAGTANGFQDTHRDTYAIYSLLFTNKSDSDSVYPIADTTVPSELTEHCVILPADRRAQFAEVFADYAARWNERIRLARELSIARPYRYLDSAQVKEFMVPAPTTTSLISLGNVYFERRRTVALTYISFWCGGLCGHSRWQAFERNQGGRWERREWAHCITVASR